MKFFEKDTINWGTYELAGFYKTLINLKKENKAIWNGNGGKPEWISTSKDSSIVAFARTSGEKSVLVVANLSAKDIEFTIKETPLEGEFTDAFTKAKVEFKKGGKLSLKPWEYIVCSK